MNVKTGIGYGVEIRITLCDPRTSDGDALVEATCSVGAGLAPKRYMAWSTGPFGSVAALIEDALASLEAHVGRDLVRGES